MCILKLPDCIKLKSYFQPYHWKYMSDCMLLNIGSIKNWEFYLCFIFFAQKNQNFVSLKIEAAEFQQKKIYF